MAQGDQVFETIGTFQAIFFCCDVEAWPPFLAYNNRVVSQPLDSLCPGFYGTPIQNTAKALFHVGFLKGRMFLVERAHSCQFIDPILKSLNPHR